MADTTAPSKPADSSPGPPQAVGFTPEGARRVVAATIRVEREFVNAPAQRGRFPVGGGSLVKHAKSGASGIPAMAGTTPGSASCTIYDFNGTSLIARTDTVTVKNSFTTAVGANHFILVCRISGAWFVFAEDCS